MGSVNDVVGAFTLHHQLDGAIDEGLFDPKDDAASNCSSATLLVAKCCFYQVDSVPQCTVIPKLREGIEHTIWSWPSTHCRSDSVPCSVELLHERRTSAKTGCCVMHNVVSMINRRRVRGHWKRLLCVHTRHSALDRFCKHMWILQRTKVGELVVLLQR